jgi:acyl-CoA synthetase (AMP-forming)/AMP-acid ligase II
MLFTFPVRLIEYLNEHKINTVCWVVSALAQASRLGALDVRRPEHLTTVAFGSEVFLKVDYNKWRETLPNARFINLYGPTEATGMSAYWIADRELGENEPIPIGKPFNNTDIMLITEDGKRAKEGEDGEIYIRGTCVTMGYFKNPEKTAEAFVQNPLNDRYPEIVYRTGDIGRYNEHGELVFVTRRDSQIKHMGHRIELGEIEAVASEIQGIKGSCAVYDKDRQRIVLFYVGEAEDAAIREYILKKLPRYMLPAELVRLSAMPFTPNGKIDRKKLGESAAEI